MQVLADILSDEDCLAKVKAEREHYLEILRRRGAAFMEEADKAGLSVCPYDSGFFITIPCENPEAAGQRLQDMDIFVIPMGRGLRVSVASNTEAECRAMPARIKEAIQNA